MSRTYRNVPKIKHSWDWMWEDGEDYQKKMERGLARYPISHPDEPFEEVDTEQEKRWAKKRTSRKRRLEAKKEIAEQMKDIDL